MRTYSCYASFKMESQGSYGIFRIAKCFLCERKTGRINIFSLGKIMKMREMGNHFLNFDGFSPWKPFPLMMGGINCRTCRLPPSFQSDRPLINCHVEPYKPWRIRHKCLTSRCHPRSDTWGGIEGYIRISNLKSKSYLTFELLSLVRACYRTDWSLVEARHVSESQEERG